MKKTYLILVVIFIFALQIFSSPCFLPYQANQAYASGSEVSFNGKNYKSKWWTITVPGAGAFVSDWDELGNCDETIDTVKVSCFPKFKLGDSYVTGAQVSHNGKNYIAKWQNLETPGKENWGGWEDLGKCEVETIVDLTEEKDVYNSLLESTSQFLLFATDTLNLNSGVKLAGTIGANGDISLGVDAGWQTIVNGDIYSKGKVITIAEASINGNVYANGGLQLGWQAKHNGELITDLEYDFNIEKKTFKTTSNAINGRWREDVTLSAGNYGDISIKDGGGLELSKGIYNAKTLSINSNDLELKLNIASGDNIELNIQDSLHFGSGTKITFINGELPAKKSPLNFKIYTNQTNDLIIPDHSEINAIIYAPNAKVIVYSGAKVAGAIFAKSIEVKYGAMISGVPYITDIFHSEYHFAPEFDVKTTEYFSVISPEANIEFVEVDAPKNYRVTKINNSVSRYIFEIEDTVSGVVSYYTIDFQTINTPAIFVKSDGNGDGSSWGSALNNLQAAIELAKKTGKEIRVAEGYYGNITIGQGTKILGGYALLQTSDTAEGNPYNTIIDGANTKQSLVIKGFSGAKSVKIKGLTIQNGYSETNGGGISSDKVVPKFEEIIVLNNTAEENGAGIYAPKGVQDFNMVLVENNTGKSAFYIGGEVEDSIKAERIVVSQNSGIGLEARGANISFVNSIFYGNMTAVSADSASVEFVHNTFAKNDSVGIVAKNSKVNVVNTILWNEQKELVGDGFDVEYSCVKGGFAGEGNIADDPLFVEVEKPKGINFEWGSFSDGLRLKIGSKCIDVGISTNVMEDILYSERPVGKGFDFGAYEFIDFGGGDGYIGKCSSYVFIPVEYNTIESMVDIMFENQIYLYSFSNAAYVAHVKIPRNKHTKNKNSVTVYITPLNSDGNKIDGINEIAMTLYKYKEQDGTLYFMSVADWKKDGKTIIFTPYMEQHGYENPWAHLIYIEEDGRFQYRLPNSQFK